MADANIKKIIGNVAKLKFFSWIYRKYVILTWKPLAIPQFLLIYTILVK